MGDPMEMVSGGGQCALKLTPGNAIGRVLGYSSGWAGSTNGVLPIKIVEEVCTIKEVKP